MWLASFGYFVEETPKPEMSQPDYRYQLYYYDHNDRARGSIYGNYRQNEDAQREVPIKSAQFNRFYFVHRVDLNDSDESEEFE